MTTLTIKNNAVLHLNYSAQPYLFSQILIKVKKSVVNYLSVQWWFWCFQWCRHHPVCFHQKKYWNTEWRVSDGGIYNSEIRFDTNKFPHCNALNRHRSIDTIVFRLYLVCKTSHHLFCTTTTTHHILEGSTMLKRLMKCVATVTIL